MPTVPTYNERRVEPAALPAVFQRIQTTPDDFGAGMGRSLVQGGKMLDDLSERLTFQQKQNDAIQAAKALAEFNAKWSEEAQKREQAGGDPATYAASFTKDFDEDAKQAFAGLSEGARERIGTQLPTVRASYVTKASAYQYAAVAQKQLADADDTLDSNAAVVRNDPSQFERVQAEHAALVSGLAVPPAAKERALKIGEQRLALSLAEGFVTRDPMGSIAAIRKGEGPYAKLSDANRLTLENRAQATITGRLQQQALDNPVAVNDALKAGRYDDILDPSTVAQLRGFADGRIRSLANEARANAATEAAMMGENLTAQARAGDPVDPQELAAYRRLVTIAYPTQAPRLLARLEGDIKTGQAIRSLDSTSVADDAEVLAGMKPQPGDKDYAAKAQTYATFAQAVAQKRQAIARSPGDFTLKQPTVYAEFSRSLQDPRGLGVAMQRATELQAAQGVPPNRIEAVPPTMAKAMVEGIQSRPSSAEQFDYLASLYDGAGSADRRASLRQALAEAKMAPSALFILDRLERGPSDRAEARRLFGVLNMPEKETKLHGIQQTKVMADVQSAISPYLDFWRAQYETTGNAAYLRQLEAGTETAVKLAGAYAATGATANIGKRAVEDLFGWKKTLVTDQVAVTLPLAPQFDEKTMSAGFTELARRSIEAMTTAPSDAPPLARRQLEMSMQQGRWVDVGEGAYAYFPLSSGKPIATARPEDVRTAGVAAIEAQQAATAATVRAPGAPSIMDAGVPKFIKDIFSIPGNGASMRENFERAMKADYENTKARDAAISKVLRLDFDKLTPEQSAEFYSMFDNAPALDKAYPNERPRGAPPKINGGR